MLSTRRRPFVPLCWRTTSTCLQQGIWLTILRLSHFDAKELAVSSIRGRVDVWTTPGLEWRPVWRHWEASYGWFAGRDKDSGSVQAVAGAVLYALTGRPGG